MGDGLARDDHVKLLCSGSGLSRARFGKLVADCLRLARRILVLVEVWQTHVVLVTQGVIVVDLIVAAVDHVLLWHAELGALLAVRHLRVSLTIHASPVADRELMYALARAVGEL